MNNNLKRIGVLALAGVIGLLLASLVGAYVVLGRLGLAFLLAPAVRKIIRAP